MTKANLKTQILQLTKGGMFVNLSQLQRVLGAGKAYTREIVKNLDYWENGKEKRYNVDEVVQAIWNGRRAGQ